MSPQFEAVDLEMLRADQEVEIETSGGDEGPTHRATIWIVVDPQDRVLVRTYRGPQSRWFREITARPEGQLHVRGRSLPVRAVPATDDERVLACSDGLRRKYAGQYAVRSMTSAHLETTLELVPR